MALIDKLNDLSKKEVSKSQLEIMVRLYGIPGDGE